ncbi:hypothetical protein [Nocardia testacea]|uniref:hypothetical protein n=1 Tax=Nocardia testacea TaxID=248551 RepID=UPI003A89FE4A
MPTQVLAGDPAALGAAAAIRIRATELAWLVGVFRACHRSMGVCIERVPMVVLGVRRATEVATAVIGPADFAVAEQWGGQFRPGGDAVQEYLRRRWPVRPVAVDTPVDRGKSADSRRRISPGEREVAVPGGRRTRYRRPTFPGPAAYAAPARQEVIAPRSPHRQA